MIVMTAEASARLAADIEADVGAFHDANPDVAGIGVERLRLLSRPRLPADAFKALLAGLAQQGRLVLQGAWVRLPRHEARLSEVDVARWGAMAPLLGGEQRFRPPRVRDVAAACGFAEADVRRLCKTQSRMGVLDEIAHDHFFLRETTAEMVDILSDVAAGQARGEVTAGLFRDRLEKDGQTVGRKVAIQILEFFDRHGVTLRRGDLRRINPHRLDLFRVSTGAKD